MNSALTLASIAWLILSVWMAIDANILIFSTKDELRLWSNLDKALVNWFDKSWSAIWDSNLTLNYYINYSLYFLNQYDKMILINFMNMISC